MFTLCANFFTPLNNPGTQHAAYVWNWRDRSRWNDETQAQARNLSRVKNFISIPNREEPSSIRERGCILWNKAEGRSSS